MGGSVTDASWESRSWIYANQFGQKVGMSYSDSYKTTLITSNHFHKVRDPPLTCCYHYHNDNKKYKLFFFFNPSLGTVFENVCTGLRAKCPKTSGRDP